MRSAHYHPPPCNSPWIHPGLTTRALNLHTVHRTAPEITALLNAEFGLALSVRAVARKLRRIATPEMRQSEPNLTITLPSVGGAYRYRSGRLEGPTP